MILMGHQGDLVEEEPSGSTSRGLLMHTSNQVTPRTPESLPVTHRIKPNSLGFFSI